MKLTKQDRIMLSSMGFTHATVIFSHPDYIIIRVRDWIGNKMYAKVRTGTSFADVRWTYGNPLDSKE